MGKRKSSAQDVGKWGEDRACSLLRGKGYRILSRRIRIGNRDEIDIVARDKNVLIFVEVKTRKTEDFGQPLSAVDRKKRHALSRAAARYLKRLRDPNVFFRFDIVEVIGSCGEGDPVLRHYENAFNLDPVYRIP